MMGEYLIAAVTLSLIASVVSSLAHPASDGVVRTAVGAVVLLFIAAPAVGLIRELPKRIELPEPAAPVYGDLSDACLESYLDGVRAEICSYSSLPTECVRVSCEGFRLEDISCTRLTVTLSGRGVLTDHRTLRQHLIDSLNIKECEIVIEGK